MSHDLTALSLGAGVQSTCLYWMADAGEVEPKPDVAIFADTQVEPPWVYETLERMRELGSIPVEIATAGSLGEALNNGVNSTGQRFASIPFWVRGKDGREAPGRRQCTREYKIDVVKNAVRRHLGLKPRQRATHLSVEEWVGISRDEAHRAKPSRYSWITTRWPLLELRMARYDCEQWLKDHGHPVPEKSACVFCPYRGAAEYARWRREHPELFEEACKWDDLIRSKGTMRGTNSEQYVLRTLTPLRDLDPNADHDPQLNLFGNECEGMCGV